MRIETLGDEDGEPSVAVVGAVHGDEPCGARAIERLLADPPAVVEPAKLIVANERALDRGRRYVDADLNRVFPGDPESGAHEKRLAHRLLAEIEGCTTLGIHSTVSTDEPFGTLANVDRTKAEAMRAMPVAHAADFTGAVSGRSVNLPDFFNVEAAPQGTERAVDQAHECILAFLRASGVLPGDPEPTETRLYAVSDVVEKEPGREYRVVADNFERVPAGEPYATADGDPVRVEGPFWPVLMSGDGHETILGYRSELVGPIRGAVDDA
ncbi:succinylglutamate desuccinylase [Halobacteriales archaeon QS_1_68_17]|nr:MAG: succinylglutamate desuccinylase [Halobacteriales archaeon QS_1_68_17]